MLNSEEIVKYLIDPLNLMVKQQVGVDLTIEKIKQIKGDNRKYLGIHLGNAILKERTLIKEYEITYHEIPIKEKKIDIEGEEITVKGWFLDIGTYSLTFNQGCKLPNFVSAEIKNRSSLNRLGSIINSGIFDPGFETQNMGATLYVSVPILIEYQARLAQIIMHSCLEINNEYKGQYQKEKDVN